MHQCINYCFDLTGDSPCLGERAGEGGKYCWLTYNEVSVYRIRYTR